MKSNEQISPEHSQAGNADGIADLQVHARCLYASSSNDLKNDSFS
jgi:hypothetical protein